MLASWSPSGDAPAAVAAGAVSRYRDAVDSVNRTSTARARQLGHHQPLTEREERAHVHRVDKDRDSDVLRRTSSLVEFLRPRQANRTQATRVAQSGRQPVAVVSCQRCGRSVLCAHPVPTRSLRRATRTSYRRRWCDELRPTESPAFCGEPLLQQPALRPFYASTLPRRCAPAPCAGSAVGWCSLRGVCAVPCSHAALPAWDPGASAVRARACTDPAHIGAATTPHQSPRSEHWRAALNPPPC